MLFVDDAWQPQSSDEALRLLGSDSTPDRGAPSTEAAQSPADGDLHVGRTPEAQQCKVVAVLRRLDTNQAYVVGDVDFRIGREKRCDLIIPDPSVSRLHAEISIVGGRYLLRDLGRVATQVNGRRLDQPHPLKPGDVIRIAGYEFVFARRPATAEEIVRSGEVTPVRSAVPDAPTLQYAGSGSGRGIAWILILGAAGLVALVLL